MDFTIENIECLKVDVNGKKRQVDEFNRVLIDLGEFLSRQLTILRLQEVFDEDIIRREEDRIDLEQNKIG